VDAFTEDDPAHRLRLLTRYPLEVANCAAATAATRATAQQQRQKQQQQHQQYLKHEEGEEKDKAEDEEEEIEPAASVARYCALHGFPSSSCTEVLSHAKSACDEVKRTAACQRQIMQQQHKQQNQRQRFIDEAAAVMEDSSTSSSSACTYRGMFELDLSRRFQIVVGGDTFLVEVAPWDDEAKVAQREGAGMGLQGHEVAALEAHLRSNLDGDADFQEHRRKALEALMAS
jgi:hypothetical protein